MSCHHQPRQLPGIPARRLGVLAAILLAFVAIAPTEGTHIEGLSGSVELGRGEPPSWRPAEAGEALAPGDVVRTGRDGRVELDLGTGTVRLYGDSLMRIPADAMGPHGAEAVRIERGHSRFDVLRRDDASRFEVRMPEVVVSVKGTRFSVGFDERQASVSVYRGLVGVRALAAEVAHETLVREGYLAVGGAGRPFELFLHDAVDPWDAWSSRVAPPPLPERAVERLVSGPAALADARGEARDGSRSEVLHHAMQRRPEVAERVAKLVQEQRMENMGADLHDAESERPVRRRDAVLDAPIEKRREALDIPFVEALVNPPAGGPVPPSGGGFDIQFIDGTGVPGPDRVRIDGPNALSWSFDQNFLEDVIDGDDVLPPDLLTELQAAGVDDPMPLVKLLLRLLDD
ncbi:MAG: FecR family protein [Myxococcales bacterium]|nr:FecR family protein [Myxococcales bacterium]